MKDMITFSWVKEYPNMMAILFKEMLCTFSFKAVDKHIEANLLDVHFCGKKYLVEKNDIHKLPSNPYSNLFFKNLENGIFPNSPKCFSLDMFQSEAIVLDYLLKASEEEVQEKIEDLAFNLLLKAMNIIVVYLLEHKEHWTFD